MTKQSTVDAGQFRACMRRVAAQVGVISTSAGDQSSAMTATAITSLSAEPTQILVCVHHLARATSMIRSSGVFTVNFLAHGQQDVAQQCAQSGLDPAQRFDCGEWVTGTANGVPRLLNAAVNLECQKVSDQRHGTHHVIVGLVLQGHFSSALPLIYHDGSYGELCRHTQPVHWASHVRGF